jgi:hypothetical protein
MRIVISNWRRTFVGIVDDYNLGHGAVLLEQDAEGNLEEGADKVAAEEAVSQAARPELCQPWPSRRRARTR